MVVIVEVVVNQTIFALGLLHMIIIIIIYYKYIILISIIILLY